LRLGSDEALTPKGGAEISAPPFVIEDVEPKTDRR
jgi:hypothetical protein